MRPTLVASKFTKRYWEEVEMALCAIDCALNRGQAIYCSSELTSGRRMYEALRKNNAQNEDELKEKRGKDWVTENIRKVNFENARRFAEYVEYVRNTIGDNTMVITPAPLEVPGWGQPEYNEFWQRLLHSRIKSVWFNCNWEFSNGCTFEFAVAQDHGLRTFDRDGKPLDRCEGIELITAAIEQLETQKFDTSKLADNLERLQAVNSAGLARRFFASRVNGARVPLKRHSRRAARNSRRRAAVS